MTMNRLWVKDAPIIDTMLETDVYKILMLYFIWRFFPNLRVKFAFTNRTTSTKLAREVSIPMLKEQFTHVQTLRFTDDQLDHIFSWGMHPREDFLEDLKTIRLPDVLVEETEDGQLKIEVEGSWFHATLWELYVLPIVSECRTRFLIGEDEQKHRQIIQEGEKRLLEKTELIKDLRWKIALFDLRRRLSGMWERHSTDIVLNEVSDHISGISNVQVAWEQGKEAQGTIAHEVWMALAALRRHESDEAVLASIYEVLEKWQSIYGHKALIMLPDTYGSDLFYQHVPRHFLWDWKGPRQDSGDPIEFGEKRIVDYEDARIDPKSKLFLFTDGLTVPKMINIENTFYGRVNGGFGWGTNKGHDVPLIKPLSMVMKLVGAAGNHAVKFSDNISKAIGDQAEQAEMKQIFGYDVAYDEKPVY